ncbi:glycosyltransferase family 39 protein [Candidatus Uhrbacteria bacterium]|nr:glycosyltransferase family 39 protein [Candidatus Uhrbacteria bacterium]
MPPTHSDITVAHHTPHRNGVIPILRNFGWFIAVGCIAATAMLTQLGTLPIQNWDEGIHGAVSLEIVEDGDWLTPHYSGGAYFRKPPLKIWTTALLFQVFGVNSWTLRLPSAIAGIATALLVAWWVWEWRRDRTTAFLAGAITATMRPIFFHAFRTGEMDGMLTLFLIVALYSWWKMTNTTASASPSDGWDRRRWPLCLGAALGLAVMSKSAGGLLPLPIIAIDWLIHRRAIRISFRHLVIATCTFFLIVLPWHLAMTIRHGLPFWSSYFGWHVVQRVATALHNETAGAWWYFPTLAKRFTPYTFWMIPAFLFACREVWERHDRTSTLLLIWFTVGFVGYSAAGTRFDWYLLPLYPAAVMFVAIFLRAARTATRDWLVGIGHLGGCAASIAYLPTLFPAGSRIDAWVERAYAPLLHPLVVAGTATTVAVFLIRMIQKRWPQHLERALMLTACSVTLIPGIAITIHHLRARGPEHPFADVATRLAGSHGVLIGFAFDYHQYPAGYFLLRSRLSGDVRVLDGQHDIPRTLAMLRERSPAFLLTPASIDLADPLRAAVHAPQSFGPFLLWQRQ